jgi:signal transduction histidine kinase
MMTGLFGRPWPQGMRGAVLGTALASTAATAALRLLPQLHAGYQWSALHVALETTASLIALLAAFLVTGRLRRRTLLNELMLASALAVLALSHLFFGTLPVLGGPATTELTAWAWLAGNMLGAFLFALAAFIPRTRLRRSAFVLAGAAAAATAVLALSAVLISAFTAGAGQRVAPGELFSNLDAHPVLLGPQIVMAVLYGVAVVGFLTRSEQFGDEFLGWLAIAAVLATASRIDYSLYPALDSDSAYFGEVFRLLFYAVLLVGSLREIGSYWRALSDAAVLEERRRVARDLHDGLAQELAYLARNLALLAGKVGAERVEPLRRAVERAQAESRQAIHALTAPPGRAVDAMLAEAASEIAERFNVELAFDSVPDVRLSEPRAEALVRIACEAVTNAARHSGASLVRLSLTRDGQRVRLRVSDAGHGFNPDASTVGFGLISLQERARSVGGELWITSTPGCGSEVEAVL